MKQYLDIAQRIIDEGVWVTNKRTGVRCLTVINADLTYDVGAGEYPIVTTRRAPFKLAVAELLGFIRGVSSAAEFRKLGTKSWDANANENKAWLANPNRKGEDDCGKIYGAMARNWTTPNGGSMDILRKIVDNLSKGIDDRGEILTFWNPAEFDQGCLRPCMYEHQFSLLGDKLYLNSTQRSSDLALGTVANSQQVYLMLAVIAQITGNKPALAHHRNVNTHIYENQLDLMKEQIKRVPLAAPTLKINPKIKTLEDLETWVTVDDFELVDYRSHAPIKYPFTV
jgi:thymidylate synthase